MDIFLEYLVKRKTDTKSLLLRILIILSDIIFDLIMLILSMTFQNFTFIFMILLLAAIYGTWFLLNTFKIEFEYIVTNGEMDIDKILAQKKRKRLITINFRDMDIMAPVSGEHKREFENQAVINKIDASVSPEDNGAYFIIAKNQKHELSRIIFSPDERIIKSAKSIAPRKVFVD